MPFYELTQSEYELLPHIVKYDTRNTFHIVQYAIKGNAGMSSDQVNKMLDAKNFLVDAPKDGQEYSRQNGNWVLASSGGGLTQDQVNALINTAVAAALSSHTSFFHGHFSPVQQQGANFNYTSNTLLAFPLPEQQLAQNTTVNADSTQVTIKNTGIYDVAATLNYISGGQETVAGTHYQYGVLVNGAFVPGLSWTATSPSGMNRENSAERAMQLNAGDVVQIGFLTDGTGVIQQYNSTIDLRVTQVA